MLLSLNFMITAMNNIVFLITVLFSRFNKYKSIISTIYQNNKRVVSYLDKSKGFLLCRV